MAVQVSQSTFDALTAQRADAESARDSYQDLVDLHTDRATDLAAVLADLEVTS